LTRIDCERVRESAYAYCIGALDHEESRPFEQHLLECEDCRDVIDRAREPAAALALSVPLRHASPSLKARVRASAGVLTDIRRRRTPRWWPASVAAMFVLVVGLAGWGTYLQVQVEDLRDRNTSIGDDATATSRELADVKDQLVRSSQEATGLRNSLTIQDALLQIVTQPDVANVELIGTGAAPEASARYVWSENEQLGALTARNLPDLENGTTYHLWLVYENGEVSAGAFLPDRDGRGRLVVQDLEGWRYGYGSLVGFAVSMEPIAPGTERTRLVVLENAPSRGDATP
jgi:hypothetical protein